MFTLITGGLGYIGSNISKLLNKDVIIIDNSYNSKLNYKKYLPNSIVFKQNLNYKNLSNIFSNYNIRSVIHLAAYKSVYESDKKPLTYYKNNILTTLDLLQAMDKYDINQLVFSSSATVYGEKNELPFKEDSNLSATNTYGNTKIFNEQMIDDFCRSKKNFKAISLRYFNPLGSDKKGYFSDNPINKSANIMPKLIQAATGKKFLVYGNDYKTSDGTCHRDYIHVLDLASAHIRSLKSFNRLHGHNKFNIGLGKSISVLKLIKIFEKVNNVRINYEIVGRRSGDVGKSYAKVDKAKKVLNWSPKFTYYDMCKDAWKSMYLKNDI